MNLYHRDTGKGPVLLLLHGFCESHKIWNGLAQTLSPHFRLLMPDLPGFGRSEPFRDSFSITDVAHCVAEWLSTKASESVLIIGHSLGGYVSLEMVHAHPDAFAGLVLFQSTAYKDTDEKKTGRDRTIEKINESGLQVFVKDFIPRLFFDKEHPAIPGLVQDASDLTTDSVIWYVKAMRDRVDRTDVLTLLGDRLLLVGGDQDTFVSVEQLEAQKGLGDGIQCQILRQSAHMGMLENPQNSADLTQSFANQCFSRFRTRMGTK